MRCSECDSLNPEGSKYCNGCGAVLSVACPDCSRKNPPGSLFCNECGKDLRDASTLDAEVAGPAESTAGSDAASGGERRQATVLFSDVSGYTSLGERLDPEDVNVIMSRVKDETTRVIEKFQGTVNQFIGDQVVALFGIPVAHEDDPLRAVEAAFALHDVAAKLSAELSPRLDVPLKWHTGINTGLMVTHQRDLRDGLYGLTGDAANVGARLMAEAKADEILLGPETARIVRPYVVLEPLELVQLKGKAERIVPYRAKARTAVRSRFDAAETRGFSDFSGRAEELAFLQRCVNRLMEGEGQFIVVEGEPGIGKSRLLYEFRHDVDRERIAVLEGRCQADGNDTPYLPIIDALRRGLGLEPEDREATILEKVVNNSKAIDPALEEFIPQYLHLLSVKSSYTLPESLQGMELRNALERALSALIEFSAKQRLLILLLEDWHWSDSASRSALNFLAGMVGVQSVMIVVTTRPDSDVEWEDLGYHNKIHLSALSPSDTESVIKSTLGVGDIPDALTLSIHQSTQGNPLFIEEVCFSLVEAGALTIRDRQAILHTKLEDVILPTTVQSIIRARLDRLETQTNQVLSLAAVVGREFAKSILDRLITRHAQLDTALRALMQQKIIQQLRVAPEIEFTFRHILTREVAYETLLQMQRKQMHGAVAAAIEEVYAERLEEHIPALAYHYLRSDRFDKAIEFSMRAGERSASLYANTEATSYFENALKIALARPDSSEMKSLRVDLILKLANVGSGPHDIERDRKNLQGALELARDLEDDQRLAKVLYWLGRLCYMLADLKTAVDYAGQSLAIADRLGDDGLAAPAVNLMGRAYWQLSDFARSAEMTERSVEQMRRIGNKTEESTAAGFVGALFGYMGEFDKALSYAARAIALARELGNPFAEAANHHYHGIIRDQQGEWALALSDYGIARGIADSAGDAFRRYIIMFMEGRAHVMLGDPERGRTLIQESLALAGQLGTKFLLGQAKCCLAACAVDKAEAIEICKEAIELADAAGDKFSFALAHQVLSELLSDAARHDLQGAEDAIGQAILVFREIGARPEMARSQLRFGRLLSALDARSEAQVQFMEAARTFDSLGMEWDLARVKAIQNSES